MTMNGEALDAKQKEEEGEREMEEAEASSLKQLVRRAVSLCPNQIVWKVFWKEVEPYLTPDVLIEAVRAYKKDNSRPLIMKGAFLESVLEEWCNVTGRKACVFYRLQNALYKRKVMDEKKLLLPLANALNNSTNCRIAYSAEIGEGLNIYHGEGTHIAGAGVKIGKNFAIYQNVTVGINHTQKEMGQNSRPSIGDDVMVCANACVIGGIKVGSHVKIGAGSVVVKDVPGYSTVVGNHPFRIIDRSPPPSMEH